MHYADHLKRDRRLRSLLVSSPQLRLTPKKDICTYLCASIISQQLSVKAADVIYKRFIGIYGGKAPVPCDILNTPVEILRLVGLSNAKLGYVQNVARFALEEGLEYKKLQKMEDEAIVNYLTAIKGVGRWTVEMLLIFALARENVFAVDDGGIQNAMSGIYKLDKSDKKQLKQDMLQIAARWSPFRSYGCLLMWRYMDSATDK
jgi:DNA-3-methyladenine glycosylase II